MSDVFNPSKDLRHLYTVHDGDRSFMVDQHSMAFDYLWKCGRKSTFRCGNRQNVIKCKATCVLVHATGEIIFGKQPHNDKCITVSKKMSEKSKLVDNGFNLPGMFVLVIFFFLFLIFDFLIVMYASNVFFLLFYP